MNKVSSKVIADFLSKKLLGKNILITGPSPMDLVKKNTFFFLKPKFIDNFEIPENTLAIVSKKNTLVKTLQLSYPRIQDMILLEF